ncbi:MAG: MarR family transcriptional regulator [Gammaproteobacteria bacterium]|nr:MarR family transcriptional regulator [Gammaproteobacteria bacterium]
MKLAKKREVTFLLQDMSFLFYKVFSQRLEALGVTRSESRTLVVLSGNQGVKQAELADRLDLTAITVGPLIDRLEKLEAVERRADPADRRSKLLFLTAKGDQLVDQVCTAEIALSAEINSLAGLGSDEVKNYIAYSAAIHGALRSLVNQSGELQDRVKRGSNAN